MYASPMISTALIAIGYQVGLGAIILSMFTAARLLPGAASSFLRTFDFGTAASVVP
jgi:hypothetical protein